jgi:2,3-bisphosphoglycerate-independent phosphoglycerate mutase
MAKAQKATDAINAVEQSYSKNVTDEFLLPTIIVDESQQPLATIKNGDAVICFNFRTDRCREITQALSQADFPDHDHAQAGSFLYNDDRI